MIDSLAVDMEWGHATINVAVVHLTYRRAQVTTSWNLDAGTVPLDAIDPTLRDGPHHVAGLPGALQDCSPDRWGRRLVDKRIRAEAREQGRTPRTVTDVDYLIGVSDLTRQGALRFRHPGDHTHLHPENRVPRLVELARLLDASDRSDDDLSAVRELLDAGSASLGGARPKASVRDTDGRLALAKFPHMADDWDVMGWEATALDLAERAGVGTPSRRLATVDGRHVLILDRFDRDATRGRIPYVSAMTLLEARDGQALDYEDIAMHLGEHGTAVGASLADLFLRATLSVALHNTDDHLRNHGFLFSRGGWSPSPIFDVNPDPDPGSLRVTAISGATGIDDEYDGLMEFAEWCRLTRTEAEQSVERVVGVTSAWREVATSNGVPHGELNVFADSFARARNVLTDGLGSSTHTAGSPTRSGASGRRLRRPPGSPAGGQFTARGHDESDVPSG